MPILALFFFLVAALYASAGFGGGSTYTALLVLSDVDYRVLPAVSLVCNIIVTAGGVWRHESYRADFLKKMAPWLAGSLPAAWLGGLAPISRTAFVGLLGISLLVSAAALLWRARSEESEGTRDVSPARALMIGATLGGVSGLVGIGGGVFLAPILYFLRWGTGRAIAGACSLFIALNSVFGLSGQLMKLDSALLLSDISVYWVLPLAVLAGGQIGAHFSARLLPEHWLRRITALLILYVAVRLLLEWAALIWPR